MVESSEVIPVKPLSTLPFREKIPSYIGTAIILSFIGIKLEVVPVLKHLSKGTASYLKKHEKHLDGFWVIATPVHFSGVYLGNKPGKLDGRTLTEQVFPSLDTKFVPLNYRIENLQFVDIGWKVSTIRLNTSCGTQSPLMGFEDCKPLTAYDEVSLSTKIAKVKAYFYRGEWNSWAENYYYALAQIVFLDKDDKVVSKCGQNKYKRKHR